MHPHLEEYNKKKILMVHDKPYLLLAGEVHNSSSSSLIYMEEAWDKAERLHLNTLLLPITWELLEPEEGKFDFSLIDGLIAQARERNKKVVVLWFGAWKNGQCQYVPTWVKSNPERFERVQVEKEVFRSAFRIVEGMSYLALSVFCQEVKEADAKAYRELMKHIRQVDEEENTVIMVQVENEVGVLNCKREQSDIADQLFAEQVDTKFVEYMRKHTSTMASAVRAAVEQGVKEGSWKEVFGEHAEEIFSAYYMADYVNYIAAAGKEEYPLPTLVNCWLDNGAAPGEYPTGGPVPKMYEVWRYKAPCIDVISPDIYLYTFHDICNEYVREDNPLMISETVLDSYTGPREVYVFGHYHALGYSPFGYEDMGEAFSENLHSIYSYDLALATPQNIEEYAWYNHTISEMMDVLTDKYGTEDLQAVSMEIPEKNEMLFGKFGFRISKEASGCGRDGVCLICRESENTFYMIIKGCSFSVFSNNPEMPFAEILLLEEGGFSNNVWVGGRRINGDEISVLSYTKPTLLKIQLHLFRE